jgi:The GLUG motif
VMNVSVTGRSGVGGLLGSNGLVEGKGYGTVTNSYSSGSVTGEILVGGLVGYNRGIVSSSNSSANVAGEGDIGGLVGWNRGAVYGCHSTSSVTGPIDSSRVGGLVGENDLAGSINHSYSNGSVSGSSMVGGLVGQNTATVGNSYSSGSVTASAYVGGLVGHNAGTVSDSYSTSSVTGSIIFGGLVGWNSDGTVTNSYYNYDEVLINGQKIITIGALFNEDFEQWVADNGVLDISQSLSQENGYYLINNVSDFESLLAFGQDGSLKFKLTNDLDLVGKPNFYIPYLAGEFDGNGHKISNLTFHSACISHVGLFGFLASGGKISKVGAEGVNISDTYSEIGGLVGSNELGIISESYSTGSVAGYSDIGGLVGCNADGSLSNSYAADSVSGTFDVGGLVGRSIYATVSDSYSSGSVSSSYCCAGGLVGSGGDPSSTSNSFWDIQTSGQATSDGGTGKNTTEMQDITTFSGAGWNITAVAPNETNPAYIWNIVGNVTYPFLGWQP